VEAATPVAVEVVQVLRAQMLLTATQVVMEAQDTQVASLVLQLIMQVAAAVVELVVQ
jgi:hypothetical protein